MIQAAKDAHAILNGFGLVAKTGGRASPVDGSVLPGLADCDGGDLLPGHIAQELARLGLS